MWTTNQPAESGSAPARMVGRQPGPDDTRLPAAARADHGDEATRAPDRAEPGEQALHDPLAAEEVRRVGFAERVETLVRVGRRVRLDDGLVEARGHEAESVQEAVPVLHEDGARPDVGVDEAPVARRGERGADVGVDRR